MHLGNEGFDNGLIGWSGSHTAGGVEAVTWDGRTTARITDTSATNAYGRESLPGLPAVAGARYSAYATVWVESGKAELYLRFRNSTGSLLGIANSGEISGNQWRTVTAAGRAPAGTATVSALIYSGVSNVGTAYWDEVLISKDVTDLGVQIESTVPNATTFAAGRAYSVFTGTADANPQVAAIDLATETVTRKITLPDTVTHPTVGGWAAATATDGSVYLGTYPNAKLYKYVPGEATITDLGKAEGGNSVVWELEPGAHNEVYGGTSDDGRFFKYENGAVTTLLAPATTNATYVRSLAHDPVANVSFLGTGSNAALIRYDHATKTTTNLLPAAYAHNSMVGGLTWTGNRLFAWIDRTLLVLQIVGTQAVIETSITDVDLHHSPARDGRVWFVKDGLLHSYDVATKAVQATTARPGLDATGYTWFNGTLVSIGASIDGTRIFKYNPETGAWTSRVVPGTPVLPAAINALGAGPDGKIYTGGYLTGGTGVYDPLRGNADTSKPDRETLNGLHQTDSLMAHNGKLYVGVYPSAKIYSYAPGDAWPPKLEYTGGSAGNKAHDCEPGQGPPPQDRPYALIGGPGGTVYMGTVPKYGKRSGALTVWKDGTAGQTLCVVPNQAVVSLAYADGKVFGGTSTRGALGTNPVYIDAPATLFSYNTSTGTIAQHPLPFTTRAVTALAEVDGQIWGLAGGRLITFDPANTVAITAKQLFDEPDYANKHSRAWRDGVLLTVANDPANVYGTFGDQIFRISKSTKAMTVLHTAPGTEGLMADKYGNLYYRIGERLYRLTI